MRHSNNKFFTAIQSFMQMLAIATIALLALGAVTLSVLAAAGVLPWLQLPIAYNGAVYEAGIAVQLLITVALLALCFFIPSSLRVLQLEKSHRTFEITMSDVAEAYALCHRADREGVFTMSSEFDAVKERIAHLRAHPDLPELEPGVLEAAAEMSYAFHELAETYSDEKVSRARSFLRQRQEEIALFQERIVKAQQTTRELKRWMEQVEMDEAIAESQLSQLEDALSDVLPKLGLETKRRESNVFAMAAE